METELSKLPALTTDQMIEVDRLMMKEWGINLFQMMENAGRNLAELTRRQLGGSVQAKNVVVLCGTGNNGGGGMTAARHLHNWNANVEVILVGSEMQLKEIPAHQWNILKKIGITTTDTNLSHAEMILDAMLGYGANGNPRSPIAEWIQMANESGGSILSLDSPSGLDTTTGIPTLPCIRASATLTLALPKTGLLTSTAKPFVGELFLADIGVPPELYTASSLGFSAIVPFQKDSIVRLL